MNCPVVEICTLPGCQVDKQLLKELFTFSDIEPQFEFSTFVPAGLCNPCCLHLRGFGTGTLIYLHGSTVCLTAAHFIARDSNDEDGIVSIVNDRDDYQKYCRNSNRTAFGAFSCNRQLDVAVIAPLTGFRLSFEVNRINPFGDLLFKDDLALEYLRNQENITVVKHGCSTGVTVGRLDAMNQESLKISGVGVGPFAVQGDSGALVLEQSTNIVLGILTFIEIQPQTKGVVDFKAVATPYWVFQDWLKYAIQTLEIDE